MVRTALPVVLSAFLGLFSSSAGAVNIFFEHGLGSDPYSAFNMNNPAYNSATPSTQCNPTPLAHENGTYTSPCQLFSAYGTVFGLSHDTYGMGIAAQADSLFNAINNNSADTDYILVGSSQGGLRSRYVAQNKLSGAALNHLKAIVTFDTPHSGALIAQNVVPYLNGINNEIRIGSFGFLSLKQILASVPAASTIGDLASLTGNEPGLVDLRPGSTFINNLNGIDCHWVTQTRIVGPRGEREVEEYQVLVCQQLQSFNKIPPQVAMVSVVGTASQHVGDLAGDDHNTLEAYIWGANNTTDLRGTFSQYSSVAGIAGAATLGSAAAACAALWPWGCLWSLAAVPVGVAQLDLSHHLGNFFPEWKTAVVGETTGDSVVGTTSQSYMFNQSVLGGDRSHNTTVPSNAAHALTQIYFSAPRQQVQTNLKAAGALP